MDNTEKHRIIREKGLLEKTARFSVNTSVHSRAIRGKKKLFLPFETCKRMASTGRVKILEAFIFSHCLVPKGRYVYNPRRQPGEESAIKPLAPTGRNN